MSTEEASARSNDPASPSMTERTQNKNSRTQRARKHTFDTGWAWAVAAGVFGMMFLIIGWFRIYGIIFVALMDRTRQSAFDVSWVGTANATCFNFFAPLGSILANRFSCRVVVMTGGVIMSLGLLAAFFVTTLPMYILTIGVIHGIGAAFAYVPSVVMLGYYFRSRLGLATGIAFAGSSVSQLVLPPLTTWLLQTYTLPGTLLITAALTFNVCACGAAFFPVHAAALQDHAALANVPDVELAVTSSGASRQEAVEEPLMTSASHEQKDSVISGSKPHRRLPSAFSQLKNPLLWILMVSYAVGTFVFGALMKYIPPFGLSCGLTNDQIALILALSGLPDFLARILTGILSDRKFIVYTVRRYRLFGTSVLLIGLSSCVMPALRTYWGFMAVLFLIGAAAGMFYTMSSVTCLDLIGPQGYSEAFGWMMFLATFTHLIDSLAVAQLIDATGDYLASFLLCGSLSTVSGCLVFCVQCFVKPRRMMACTESGNVES